VNEATVDLGYIPTEGSQVRIYRETERNSRLVDYTDGSTLKETDLDTDSRQAFYLLQELLEATSDSLSISDISGEFDAENRRITNLADPVEDQDAVTKGWANTYFPNTLEEYVSDAESARDSAISAQIASETARDSAISAKNSAITAKTEAETAKTQAQTARAGAESAQTSAEQARDEAIVAKTGAESAETDAVSAKTSAESARDTALTYKNEAETAWDGAISAKNSAESARDDALFAKSSTESARDTAVQAKDTAVQASSEVEAFYNLINSDKRLERYTHDQSTPSSVWTITHELNRRPSVSVVDTADSLVEGAVDYVSLNQLTITFNAPFSGKAYLV